MPVVRELINRISFKVNPGDVKNAENAFKGVKEKGKGVLGFFGGVGNAIKSASKLLLVFSGIATKMFVDFEKNTGASNFYSRNAEEAKKLLKIVDEIASKSETTSKREARQASTILSSLVTGTGQLEKIIPFIEKISIANPKADFTNVAESVRDFVKGGDLQSLMQLIPGIKDELEILGKSNFGSALGKTLETARAEKLIQLLTKNRVRINKLAADQEQTLNNSFVRVAKDVSDFGLRFGDEISGPMKEILDEISDTMSDINNSEPFWNLISKSASEVSAAFLLTKKTIIEINKLGVLGFLKGGEGTKDAIQRYKEDPEKFLEGFTGKKTPLPSFNVDLPGGQRLNGDTSIFRQSEQILKGEDPKIVTLFNDLKDVISDLKTSLTTGLRPQFQTEFKMVHSGNVESSNEGLKQVIKSVTADYGGQPQ